MYGKIYLVNKNTRSLVAISIRGGNSATLFWHCFTQKSIYFVSWTHRTQATLLLPAWHESFYTSSPVNKHGQSCTIDTPTQHITQLQKCRLLYGRFFLLEFSRSGEDILISNLPYRDTNWRFIRQHDIPAFQCSRTNLKQQSDSREKLFTQALEASVVAMSE